MWRIEPSEQWEKDKEYYQKKRPRELEAVLRNLSRYLLLLDEVKNTRGVQTGFLHNEGSGLIAIDQKGGGKNLQETRLYIYPDDKKKVVYIITIGNKQQQSADIKYGHEFVKFLNLEEK